MLDVVPVNVVMRADGFPELGSNNGSRTLGSRATSEEHDAPASVLEGRFQQANGNGEGDTSAAQVPAIARHRPWVLLELLEGLGQLKLGLLDREKESRRRSQGHRPALLSGHAGAQGGLRETQHLLDLLCAVFLASAEHVRLGTLGVANLVDVGHGSEGDEANEGRLGEEAQAHNEGLLEGSQAVLLLARVDDI